MSDRADYVRALKQDREGYLRSGNKQRLADVDAELKRFESAPAKRSAPKRETAKG